MGSALSIFLYFFDGLLGNARRNNTSRNILPSALAQPNKEERVSSEQNRGIQVDRSTLRQYPLTAQQVEDAIQQFIGSVNKAAICDLASRLNGGRSCRVVDQRNGSFNVCFFVLFDDINSTWVVRVPISPVVNNAWNKVVSEVTTIRYIKRTTTIPVPQIYAYGKDDTIVEGISTPFILMEFIHGQQLHTRTFFHTTKFQRRNLYIDLINILAQLRSLEFPAAGSLMPNQNNPDDEANPIIGPFLSMTTNEFERKCQEPLSSRVLTSFERRCQEPLSSRVFTSVKPFLDLHCYILSETFELPTEELEHRQAKMEIFALDSVSKEIKKYIDSEEPNCTFVLAHPDLRCGNIIVDDDFHILGIIDWEFTSIVPKQFFTPPSWITGHDPDTLLMVTGIPRDQVLQEFGAVLQEMHVTSTGWTRLWQDWGFQHAAPNKWSLLTLSPIVEILRHPSSLIDVYYSSIFQRLFGFEISKDTVVDNFFKDNQNLLEQVELQIQNSEHYTEYLRDRGLLIPDERSQQIQEFLEKAKAVLQAGQTSYDGEIEE